MAVSRTLCSNVLGIADDLVATKKASQWCFGAGHSLIKPWSSLLAPISSQVDQKSPTSSIAPPHVQRNTTEPIWVQINRRVKRTPRLTAENRVGWYFTEASSSSHCRIYLAWMSVSFQLC